MNTLGKWFRGLEQDTIVIAALILCTLAWALLLPVNPYPRDVWFETQYLLFGHFPGAENYTPIAVPAVLYKSVHWVARLLQLELRGEMYLASLTQNGLVFLSACLVYYTCKRVTPPRAAAYVAIAYLLAVLETAAAQAFWSETIVLLMFAAVLYVILRMYMESADRPMPPGLFWRQAFLSSLLTGLLVVTRMVPALLIPAAAFLLHRRLSTGRLAGYTALMCLTTAVLLAALLLSNDLRFGRAELTNSSGRHLWQGVYPVGDEALGESPEFIELKTLNPDIEHKDWFELLLPDDARREFYGERLLSRLARQAIRTHPLLYLQLGARKFITEIAQPLPDLGSDPKGNHPLLSADPLHTDLPLPPLIHDLLPIPLYSAAIRVIRKLWLIRSVVYPVSVFIALSTYGALLAGRGQRRKLRQLLLGIGLLWLVYLNRADSVLTGFLEIGTCCSVLLLQIWLTGSAGQKRKPSIASSKDRILYTFLVVMFFGSLWFSWQIEKTNTRNIVPYLPFLSVMLAMAYRLWRGQAGRWRSASSQSQPRCREPFHD